MLSSTRFPEYWSSARPANSPHQSPLERPAISSRSHRLLGQPSAPLHAVARVVTGPFVMDAIINPSATAGDVVLLAIEDEELRAMMALTLEIAGYRVVPVDVLHHTSARAQEVHPRAIVADLRDGDAGAWNEIHRLQHETSTATARLVVVTERPDAVPAGILRDGAAIIRWPFAVGELLQALTVP